MGYGRLWVKRGMGYEGFDCSLIHMTPDVGYVCALILLKSKLTLMQAKTFSTLPEELILGDLLLVVVDPGRQVRVVISLPVPMRRKH